METSEIDPTVRVGGAVLALGAACILITCVGYALAPPEASMPTGPIELRTAMAGTVRGRSLMQLAGFSGVPGDIATTAAWIALGVASIKSRASGSAIGWFVLATSTLLFTIVDAMVGLVLPALAESGSEPAFLAAKVLFDTLFLEATFTFGAGAIAAAGGYMKRSSAIGRPLAVVTLLAGVACVASSIVVTLGTSVPPHLYGGGIGVGAFAFALIGVRLWRTGDFDVGQ